MRSWNLVVFGGFCMENTWITIMFDYKIVADYFSVARLAFINITDRILFVSRLPKYPYTWIIYNVCLCKALTYFPGVLRQHILSIFQHHQLFFCPFLTSLSDGIFQLWLSLSLLLNWKIIYKAFFRIKLPYHDRKTQLMHLWK